MVARRAAGEGGVGYIGERVMQNSSDLPENLHIYIFSLLKNSGTT